MAVKKGRPTNNPKNIQMRIRLTKDESEKLKFCAENLNKTMTDVVVMGIEQVYANIEK